MDTKPTTQPLSDHRDAVAVIGMAARFPGARDVTEYWRNLCEGVESIARNTRDEALTHGMTPEQVDSPAYVGASGALADVECFDGAFFGYSAKESELMDPQHRIFLECAYHALEDAGYDSRRHPGRIGVYAGSTMNTYLVHNLLARGLDTVAAVGDMQTMLGNDKDFLTTRVSYQLDLRGPSMAVQTSCSSSLVAVHLATRALLDDECDLVLAGGASVRLPHGAGYLSSPGGASSPDGHCRAFDADAAGPVVGNGTGAVVLKRLADAIRDGDTVHAVIRGTAVSNDGSAKSSFTAPSIAGQAAAAATALARAGVCAADIDVVEAHGTATPLGDPIEVAGLSRAFATATAATGYCWLGSVKPNIGHLDSAAGIAGLIKAVLMVKHRKVPPLVNFRHPNPRLELDTTPFRIPVELTTLTPDRPVRASVNSVAMGGTNAHVVLEEPPSTPAPAPSGRTRHPVLLSARTDEALDELSRSLGQYARERPGASLPDLAHTLATGRTQWEFRRVLLATSLADLGDALATPGSRRLRDGRAVRTPRSAFLLAGQGSQRVGMGWALAKAEPAVRHRLDQALELFAAEGVDLASVLDPDRGDADEQRARLAQTDVTQPALFAVEWAIGATLLDCGVRPYALLGHSIGELTAAALAGVWTVESAVQIVAARGRLIAATPQAAMGYARLTEAEAIAAIDGTGLVIAGVNAERLVTVAGDAEEVDEFVRTASGRRLEVTRAFHSPLVAPAAAEFVEIVGRHKLSPPEIPIVSNVSGDYLTDEQATSPDYWGEHLRAPVRFADGIRRLLADGVDCVLELSPDRSLRALVDDAAPRVVCVPTLVTGSGAPVTDLLDPLTNYWLAGGEVCWDTLYHGERRTRLNLPLYPFARTRHWVEPRDGHQASPAHTQVPATSAPRSGRTPMQQYLTEVWLGLLGGDDVGLHDNFFEVGGHSLLAMQMVTVLERDGATGLALTTVFELPTIAQLAEDLDARGMIPPARSSAAELAAPTGDQAGDQAGDQVDSRLAGLITALETMSDDEVRAQLARMEETG